MTDDPRRTAACLEACQHLSTEALEAFNAAKAGGTQPRQVVYAICRNDFPVGVLTTREEAIAWCAGRRQKEAEGRGVRLNAYHWHSFILGQEPTL